jgi:AcrR family transcriptional regulator
LQRVIVSEITFAEGIKVEATMPTALAEATGNRRERRQRAMLDAAKRLFLENGYERTTIGDILAVSGGSRSTLVDLFGGKEGLFGEVLLESTRHVQAIFDTLETSDAPLETALSDTAHRFVETIFEDETMAILRILVAEGPRFPEIAETFFRLGPDSGIAKLTAYFRRCIDAGLLRPIDPKMLAYAFCGMILGDAELRAAVGDSLVKQRSLVQARLSSAIEIFLGGAGILRK